ncbi:MAG: GDSL family lipase [Gemmataceae bacterium]|nr:GDSL family lipase [Gemmataceae bacterium]
MLVRRFACAALVLALAFSTQVRAQDNPAVKPINRDNPRHKNFLKIVAKGEGDVIFIGDSITQGWEGKASKKIWDDTFGPFKPVNLGISGDQTGHVLWRLTEGKEIEPLKPKLAVIMIGTNNTGAHTAEQIAGGIKAIVDELQKQKPEMKILILGVFPRAGGVDNNADAPKEKLNPKIKAINDIIAKYADDKKVFYKDIGDKFLNKDGALERKVMPDLLHLSEEGYKIWAEAIKDDIAKLVK